MSGRGGGQSQRGRGQKSGRGGRAGQQSRGAHPSSPQPSSQSPQTAASQARGPQGVWAARSQQTQSSAPSFTPSPKPQPSPAQLQGAWASRSSVPSSQPQPQPQQMQQQFQQMSLQQSESAPSSTRQKPTAQPSPQSAPSRQPLAASSGRADIGAKPERKDKKESKMMKKINSENIETLEKGKSKTGKTGTAVVLKSNYFKVLRTPDWCLYLYDIKFSPAIDQTKLRKALVREYSKSKDGHFLVPFIYDGCSLYSSKLYNTDKKEIKYTIKNPVNDELITVTIKTTMTLSRKDLQMYQFFNIIARKCYQLLNFTLLGRNFYDKEQRKVVRDYKIELWPGYETVIRQMERDVLMNVDLTHKVLRTDTVLDTLRQNTRNLDRAIADLINTIVCTLYNNRTYRVDDVDFNVTPKTEMSFGGRKVTLIDYYKTKYGIQIQDASQPLLVTKSKSRDSTQQDELIYLVPELCYVTGITDSMRSNMNLMRDLINSTCVSPQNRLEKLLDFNGRLLREPRIVQEFSQWNLQVDSKLVDVPAREIPPERIFFKNEVKYEDFDWSKCFRNTPLFSVASLDSWCAIYPREIEHDVREFIKNMVKVGRGLGIQTREPIHEVLQYSNQNDFVNAIERILSKQSVKLVFCVVRNNRPEVYSAIKYKCTVDRAVPSQVMIQRNVSPDAKGIMSIVTKVMIQINAKLGGIPWETHCPLKNLMVIGYDVCHSTKNSRTDYGAFVASLNHTWTSYFSKVTYHENNEELSNNFGICVSAALKEYLGRHNCLPAYIVIYRDGVGEGDIPVVRSHEVPHVQKILTEAYQAVYKDKFKDYPWRMAFIVVTKRISTRFFKPQGGTHVNPKPGTVVDDVVTRPGHFDFFLVSQLSRRGTVTPTQYHVIFDSTNLQADVFQNLSYKLSYLYFNWSGPIRVPAPCQYAHKLAFLVSQYIKSVPRNELSNLMYYL